MDSILAGIILIFLILFAVLTLSGALVQAQEVLATTWQASGEVMSVQANTRLSLVSARYASSTNTAFFTYRNEGTTRLSDFETWDVIVQYYDITDPSAYRVHWLPFRQNAPNPNEWSVSGIYLDAERDVPEVFERGMVNPGEEVRIAISVDPTLGAGRTMLVTLASPSGATTPALLTRNIPPVLAVNDALMLTSRTSADITNMLLQVTDADDDPKDLIFTVDVPPTQGELNLGTGFTQADIDAGLLSYTHTGDGGDSFVFRVTDGDDSIGMFTFTIVITNAPPVLVTNAGLTMTMLSTAAIPSGRLSVADVDNTAAELVYTVSTPPTQGTLSLGSTFTQADIDAGLLSYTHTGVGSDSFSFSVSDGTASIGLYWFNITVSL